MQPSFVGRTAHAGVSFLAKLLLLAGLLLALGQTTFRQHARVVIERGDWKPDSVVTTYVEQGFSPGIVVGALIMGSLLLIVARRRDGGAHFARGFVGCAFMLAGAIISLALGGPVLNNFFGGPDWSQLCPGDYVALSFMALTFGLSAVLLLWPARRGIDRSLSESACQSARGSGWTPARLAVCWFVGRSRTSRHPRCRTGMTAVKQTTT